MLQNPIPTVRPDEPPGPLTWLRSSVARFSDGADHARRRALAVDRLAGLDPSSLRSAAFERTVLILGAYSGSTVDLMTTVGRVVPVEVLATASGLPVPATPVAALVGTVAGPYQTGYAPEADPAVADLVAAHGGRPDEDTAARIGLLVQASDATAELIAAAFLAGSVAAALADDPPVRATRRLPPGADEPVLVPLTGLPFGDGRHRCPGEAHAIAIADGVLAALRGCRPVNEPVEYVASPTLHVPTTLMVAVP